MGYDIYTCADNAWISGAAIDVDIDVFEECVMCRLRGHGAALHPEYMQEHCWDAPYAPNTCKRSYGDWL